MNVSFAGRALLAVLLLTFAAGCATRAKLQLAADQARADALVREGCYDCLLDARAAYERLPASWTLIAKLIEVDLLLALRAKELSLDPTGHLNAASQGLTQLAPAPAMSALLDIVSSVPEDATGRRVLPPALGGREALDSAIARID